MADTPLDPQYTDQIKQFEGYSAKPAWDYQQNSSGYGTKAQPGDENIPPDQLQAVHEQRFQSAIGDAAKTVDAINPNLPPGPRAALIDLTYNAGPGWTNAGLGDAVKSGDLDTARSKLLEYNKAGGKVLPALQARRAATAAWFDAPQQQAQNNAPASPAANPQAPVSLPPQAAPIFAQQPQQQAAQPDFAAMQPAMGAAPIFAPQRRPIDLSKLQAALQASRNRPIFGA